MWGAYPYLFADLLSLVPVLVAAAVLPAHRRDMFAAGVLMLPAAGRALLEAGYWQPVRLLPGNLGPEDFIYVFHVGTMSWVLAVAGWMGTLRVACKVRIDVRRYLATSGIVIGVATLCDVLGLVPLTSDVAASLVLAFFLLSRQPGLWRLAVAGALLFGTFHWLEQRVWFTLWPTFTADWNQTTAWAATWWGVPAGEIVFHYCIGAAAPMAIAWCRHAEVIAGHDVDV